MLPFFCGESALADTNMWVSIGYTRPGFLFYFFGDAGMQCQTI